MYSDATKVAQYHDTNVVEFVPNYNICPSGKSLIVIGNKLRAAKWGLPPFWAKQSRDIIINARVEGIEKKPTFKSAIANRRCIVVANGFYEWANTSRGKQPYYIYNSANHLLNFAGIWQIDGEQISFVIVTINSCDSIVHLHQRMPLILDSNQAKLWLDSNYLWQDVVRGYQPVAMEFHVVSKNVNNPKNNDKSLLEEAL